MHQLDDLVRPAEQLHGEKHDAHRDEDATIVHLDASVEAVTNQQRTDQGRARIDQNQQADEEQRQPEPLCQASKRRRAVERRGIIEIDRRIAVQRWERIDSRQKLGGCRHEAGAPGKVVHSHNGRYPGKHRRQVDAW